MQRSSALYFVEFRLGARAEEVAHSMKGIMVGRISESQTLFYCGHEINMAGF